MVIHREEPFKPMRPNEVWSLNFIHDQISNDDKLRAFTIVDVFSHKALAIAVGHRPWSEHVVDVLIRLVQKHGAPC